MAEVAYTKNIRPSADSLLVVLDGVSKENFEYLYHNKALPALASYFAGRATKAVVSTFPALTGPAHCSYLGLEDPIGYEALRFDRSKNQLHNLYPRNIVFGDLLGVEFPNSIAQHYDYSKETFRHILSFLHPEASVRKDVKDLLQQFHATNSPHSSVWFLGTDELTHRRGRAGLEYALRAVDRAFESIVHDLRPKEVLVFSDHGNDTHREKLERANLDDTISRAGFHLTTSLKKERDVVLPSLGLISFAAVYTAPWNIPELCKVVLQNAKVDFITYVNKKGIIAVESKNGKGHLHFRRDEKDAKGLEFKYILVRGKDPLDYRTVMAKLKDRSDEEGYVAEREVLKETAAHYYPNAFSRLYGAFFENKSPADILVSFHGSYYNGRKGLEKLVDVFSTHGNLTAPSSTGFALYCGPKKLPECSMVYEMSSISMPSRKKRASLFHKILKKIKGNRYMR